MTIAQPPTAWYGSSFVYYDDPPTAEELDAAAAQAKESRLAAFSPEQFGPPPGGGDAAAVVLGRFLPVHDGHRYLIEIARAHAANVWVFVRAGADDPVPLAVRQEWLAELFPGVSVAAIEDGAPWTERILAHVRPDYLVAGEAYEPGFVQRLGARLVTVDRQAVPVSGTRVRADPWGWERYLPPPVRAWYARRVRIVGAECTGKTTLAKRLAEHYATVWVPEAARTAGGPDLAASAVTRVAHLQRTTEDRLARRASRVLFCDTGLLPVRLWSERLFGASPEWLREAAEQETADLYLFASAELPFTGHSAYDRPAERFDYSVATERELQRLGRRYVRLTGSHDERFARAVEAVDAVLG
ncbi:AAA family ATPase [Dactylosporangium sucinum]|uniref:Transcriptional regulator NadR n=1 Tax=Dactylosporangium sucinum TaxID=1424081 RepID=A0A917WT28_9ACTN|nr:AAA family ATPase [Dactylosporangium sucinum]GGM29517.1 transcriptional regulator NadR [Dactylosporangium sucinum]